MFDLEETRDPVSRAIAIARRTGSGECRLSVHAHSSLRKQVVEAGNELGLQESPTARVLLILGLATLRQLKHRDQEPTCPSE